MDVEKAINRGRLVVNGPVALIFFGGFVLPLLLNNKDLLLFSFLGSFILAWLWWSFAIVKWRAWAYKRVNEKDIAELKRAAIKALLTWPDNSVFTKTEIKSKIERENEKQIESKAGADKILDPSPVQNWRTYLWIFLFVVVSALVRSLFN